MIKVSELVQVSKEPIALENSKGYEVTTVICGDKDTTTFKGKYGRRDAQRYIKWITHIHRELTEEDIQ